MSRHAVDGQPSKAGKEAEPAEGGVAADPDVRTGPVCYRAGSGARRGDAGLGRSVAREARRPDGVERDGDFAQSVARTDGSVKVGTGRDGDGSEPGQVDDQVAGRPAETVGRVTVPSTSGVDCARKSVRHSFVGGEGTSEPETFSAAPARTTLETPSASSG